MIRRDYIIRMIEEFTQALARIRGLKKGQRLGEALAETEEEFRRATGLNSETVLRLSDTELLAKLIQTDSGQSVREKMLFLTTLLRETGDISVSQERIEEGRLLLERVKSSPEQPGAK